MSIFTTVGSGLFGYIDPGSGSLILQGLLALFFGSLAFIKIFWGRLRWRKRPRKSDYTEDGGTPNTCLNTREK